MSDVDKDQPEEREPDSAADHLDDDDVRSLLRQAMRVEREKAPSVLPGVQRKIRQRSKGKFFADGWSTVNSPRSTYFVTSLVMLLILVAMYLALVPGSWGTP